MFKQKPPTNKTSHSEKEKKLLLGRQIALMCALDLEPFSIVGKRGFNLFCKMEQNK